MTINKNKIKELIKTIGNDDLDNFADALDKDYSKEEIDYALKQIEDGYASENGSEMTECLGNYKRWGKEMAIEKANYFIEINEEE